MSKHNNYSKLESCSKCGYKGEEFSSSIILGKPKWILDEIDKGNGEFEYICGNCFFRWKEKIDIPSKNEDDLIEKINILTDNYQKLSLKYQAILKRLERVEKDKDIYKINIFEDLDRKEKIDFNEEEYNI